MVISKIQELFLPKIQELFLSKIQEPPLHQILMKWIYYKGKSKIGGIPKNLNLIGKNPGEFTFPPNSWNHPMVTAVILGWAVCLKHTLKVEFCQNPCSVNVRVFVDVRASDPQNLKVLHPKWRHWPPLPNQTTQTHVLFNKYDLLLGMDGKPWQIQNDI